MKEVKQKPRPTSQPPGGILETRLGQEHHHSGAARTSFPSPRFFLFFSLGGLIASRPAAAVEMTKVHPNAAPVEVATAGFGSPPPAAACCEGEATVLTVWRKSLLFNCRGFTVFDSKGNLVFRVDSYAAGNKGEVVLMDAVGTPVLTVRRKRLSLGDHWLVYDGEETTNPRFSAKKLVSLLGSNAKEVARLTACGKPDGGCRNRWEYVVEGSYANRACAVYDGRHGRVAEIRRKEAAAGVNLGNDVFRLVVEPGMDAAVAMAVVLLLDQMFGSRAR